MRVVFKKHRLGASVAKAPAGAADPDDGPPEKANLLEDKKFDKQSWMDEQARLSAMMSNMYQ